MKAVVIAALLLTGSTAGATTSDLDQASATVNGFYVAVYGTSRPSDGIPGVGARARLAPFIAPALSRLLIDGASAEARFAGATKNMSPPLIEGDLFSSNFEGATGWHLDKCQIAANAVHCAISLTYLDPRKKNAKPFDWTDTVYLVRTPEGWRISDIGYGGTWDFGNKGRMTETLKGAIRDGNEATP